MDDKTKLDALENERVILQEKNSKNFIWHFIIPLIIGVISMVLFSLPPFVLMGFILPIIISTLIYNLFYTQPFKLIVEDFKEIMVKSFFKNYHPEIKVTYKPTKQAVKKILKNKNLIRADIYKEEDVVKGKFDNGSFYLSEVRFKNKTKNSSRTIFKGFLIHLKLTRKIFPKSLIHSHPNFLQSWIKGLEQHKEFGFEYKTEDEQKFEQEFAHLFEFIEHLSKNQGDLRIFTHGDEMTILMESKTSFLDYPKAQLNKSLFNKDYNINLSKQLNTLLYIINTFSSQETNEELDEKLELEILEKIKLKEMG